MSDGLYSARVAFSHVADLAASRSVHRAFGWLHLHEPQIRRWQIEATAIPAPPFGEARRAAWFLQRFRELGLVNSHIDEEGNALAELPGEETGRVLLLSAHLDTVFPEGTDCTPRGEDEVLFAPGISDNGAALAALLAIASAMRHAALRPPCTILFAANVGEEGEGNLRGMRYLFGAGPYAARIGAAIALEGAGTATVIHRALGSRRLRVAISGPGGHSWADYGRPNPVVALAAALVAIDALALPSHPRTTVTCGLIRGGTSINSIPADASADLDLRSVSALHLDQVELAVLKTLEQQAARYTTAAEPLHVTAERIGDRAGGELPPSSPLLLSLAAVDRHLQIVTESRIGSTDANLPLSRGVHALALSAGGTGGGMHTLDEWFNASGRTLALRRILLHVMEASRLVAGRAL